MENSETMQAKEITKPDVIIVDDEPTLSETKEANIKATAKSLCASKKLKRVIPVVVFGDTEIGEKEVYVAYLKEPSIVEFSKYMAASRKDEVIALKTLATDCFIDGDKDLLTDDSLYLWGLMPRVQDVMSIRKSKVLGF